MKLKALTILLLFSSNLLLDYSPLSIKQLIEQAEIIGKCEIIAVEDKTFTVKFLDVIKGEKPKKLKINKFRNWTCASRAIDYKVGLTELIFLSKEKDGWEALGAGNEGEILMNKNAVYYMQYIPLAKPNDYFEIEQKKLRGIIFEYADVKDAINYYIENSNIINKLNKEDRENFKSENMFLVSIARSRPYNK